MRRPIKTELKRNGMTIIEAVVIMAIIVIIGAVLVLGELDSGCGTRSPVARVQSDMRSLATAIESYYVDNNSYPAFASGSAGANAIAKPDSPVYAVPTFRNKSGPNDPLHTLTTPISYVTSYFSDPFSPVKRATFAYYPIEREGKDGEMHSYAWLMWSPGPDGDYDIDYRADYNPPDLKHPSVSLVNHTYDPTNGTKSDGDVWRAKQ